MNYDTELNRDTIALLLLAKKIKINPVTLLLLYEKYKKDTFYFFYMLAEFHELPSMKDLFKLLQDAKKYLKEPPTWLEHYIVNGRIVINLEVSRV